MEKSCLFVLNPNAGKGEARAKLLALVEQLTAAGYLVTVHPTSRAGELPAFLEKNAPRYDLVVSCGGDGTLNETVSGLLSCDPRPPLGYLPAGTVNDFASSLGIPRDLDKAIKTVVTGTPLDCDVGRFGDRYFTYIAAFGAFTEVAYQTPQQTKNLLGRTAYVLEGIKRLPKLKGYRLTLEHDGTETTGDYIFGMISNATSVGGIRLSERADISVSDGLFEVVLIKNPNSMPEATSAINAVLLQDFTSPLITSFRASRLTVRSAEETPWTLDGEYGGSPDTVEVENLHLALRVIVGTSVGDSGA